MQKVYTFRFFNLQAILALILIIFIGNASQAQLTLSVTIDDGNSDTTCGDIFGGAPDPLWRVNIGNAGWTTYSNLNGCHANYPNEQYSVTVDCFEDLPSTLQVCYRAFEDDGFGCNINESCLEEVCQNYTIPAIGNSSSFTLALANGLSSSGEVDFTIEVSGTSVASPNDEICGAIDLGVVSAGTTIGDASAGGFNNICSTSTNDENPGVNGTWNNDQGVWVRFSTPSNPGSGYLIEGLSDPTNLGNPFSLQLALYESDDGTCNGNMTYLSSSYNPNNLNESLSIECLEPNSTYFILIDGNNAGGELEGYFGIQVTNTGGELAGELRCDAVDLGMIPSGGNSTITNQSNECANSLFDPSPSAFVSQQSVWFTFQAPPSGHVIIDAISDLTNTVGLQLGLYRSFNNTCTGFFFEVESSFTIQDLDETLNVQCLDPGESYWILVDGSGTDVDGIFDMSVSDGGIFPPEITNDTTICFGTSVTVGNSTYATTGNYTYVFQLSNGCDSTVYTNLVVADSLEVDATQLVLASSPTNADGSVGSDVLGGTAPYSYLWDNGATTPTVQNLTSGNYCVTVTDSVGCTAEDCIFLDFQTFSASGVGTILSCFGDTNGQIIFSAQDGILPYNFIYSNTSGTVSSAGSIFADTDIITLNNLPAGIYEIVIEDNGMNITSIIVEITQPIQITSLLDTAICFGTTLQVGNTIYDATGMIDETLVAANGCDSIVTGMLVVLPDPSTSDAITLCYGDSVIVGNSIYSQEGTYTDNFLSIDGCDSIVTTTVSILDEISIEINATILPTGYSIPDGEAIANPSGGTGGFSFLWSDGSTNATLNNVIGGHNYCVTVTDLNNCTAETCLTILYEPNIALISNDTLDCNGAGDGELTLEVQNGFGDYFYFWENTSTGESFNGFITGNSGTTQILNLAPGNYSITVTDTYVSTVLNTTIVEPAALTAELIFAQFNVCQNDCNAALVVNPIGGTSPYSYQWSGGLPPVDAPDNICAGDYTVTITDANGCTFEYNLNVPDAPAFSASISEVASISCGGNDDGVLSAIGVGGLGMNYSYMWSTGSTEATVNNLSVGTYTVTVADGAGCTATNAISISEPPPITYDLEITDVDCWNGLNSGNVIVENISGGMPPYTYSFASNSYSSIPVFSQLVAGSYQVNVQDANGCVVSDVAIVNLPSSINLAVEETNNIYLGETVSLELNFNSNNALITWENVDTCQNCQVLEVQPYETTAYPVAVMDTITGCSESTVAWIYVSKERRIFIPNAFSPNEDGINDYFTVFADEESISNIKTMKIFDRWGTTLFEKRNLDPNIEPLGWNGLFNGQKLDVGVYVYFVEIQFIDGEIEIFKGDLTLSK